MSPTDDREVTPVVVNLPVWLSRLERLPDMEEIVGSSPTTGTRLHVHRESERSERAVPRIHDYGATVVVPAAVVPRAYLVLPRNSTNGVSPASQAGLERVRFPSGVLVAELA